MPSIYFTSKGTKAFWMWGFCEAQEHFFLQESCNEAVFEGAFWITSLSKHIMWEGEISFQNKSQARLSHVEKFISTLNNTHTKQKKPQNITTLFFFSSKQLLIIKVCLQWSQKGVSHLSKLFFFFKFRFFLGGGEDGGDPNLVKCLKSMLRILPSHTESL